MHSGTILSLERRKQTHSRAKATFISSWTCDRNYNKVTKHCITFHTFQRGEQHNVNILSGYWSVHQDLVVLPALHSVF